MSDSRLTHFDSDGASRMVDVGDKKVTRRVAKASACVVMGEATLELIRNRRMAKGDVLEVARLAGIMGSKRTSDLIPLCHPLALTGVTIDYDFPDRNTVRLLVEAKVDGKTGVEMEALTAASVAALTIYDMCKAVDRSMVITNVQLEEKSGGKSGEFRR